MRLPTSMFAVVAKAIHALALAALCGCAGSDAVPTGSKEPFEQALSAGCDFSGKWAIRFVIPVSWNGNSGIQAGRGHITQYLLSHRSISGDVMHDDAQLCGSVVPDYRSRVFFGNELYGIRFPDTLFDQNTLPHASLRSVLSQHDVGATYQTDLTALELGVALADPLHQTWPAYYGDLATIVDTDNDGYPGITVETDKRAGYSNPPTNRRFSHRAKNFFTAVRNVAQSVGQAQSCDTFEGTAAIEYIAGKFAVNAHVLGCVHEDGTTCDRSETDLLDRFQPMYSPAGTATVLMQRVADDATCAQARAALTEQ